MHVAPCVRVQLAQVLGSVAEAALGQSESRFLRRHAVERAVDIAMGLGGAAPVVSIETQFEEALDVVRDGVRGGGLGRLKVDRPRPGLERDLAVARWHPDWAAHPRCATEWPTQM